MTTPTSEVNSEEIAAVTEYPDPSTGAPSSSQSETITVNALGQTLTMTDRNGTTHTYTYDVLGRLTLDAITTAGGTIDTTVLSRATAYDTQGNAYLFTTYDDPDPTVGDVINQVQRAYNGLGQMITEWQEHGGEVDTGSSLNTQYAYVEMAGGANNSRLMTLTYPNGKVVDYNYAAGTDDTISRLTSMSDSVYTLESYTYLGLGTVVERAHAQNGLTLSYIKLSGESNGDAGDKYIGLDRFGRVVDQRWLNVKNNYLDRYQYTYDHNSNRLTRTNTLRTAFNETYTYDNLNQLAEFVRGMSLTQIWGYDAVGNWLTFETNGTTQTRVHNRLNEIKSISGATTPAYDNNGNTIGDEKGLQYIYDAWNMCVQVQDSDGDLLESFVYDALSRRIQLYDDESDVTDIFYSSSWQNLEEWLNGDVQAQYVWSLVYIDCMVYRDRRVTDTLDEGFYATNDANFNVTAIVDTTGAVQERHAYTPFGVASYFTSSGGSISHSAYGWIYLFQSGRLDGVTGNEYFRMRDLRPPLGRWMTNDPTGPITDPVNLYCFCYNNSIIYIVFLGLFGIPRTVYYWPTSSSGPLDPINNDATKWHTLGFYNCTSENKDGDCVIKYNIKLEVRAQRFFYLGKDNDKTFIAKIGLRFLEKSAVKICPCKPDKVLETGEHTVFFFANYQMYIEGEISAWKRKYKQISDDCDELAEDIQDEIQKLPSPKIPKK